VLVAELVQPRLALLEVLAARHVERDVVETDAELAELIALLGFPGVLVDPDERSAGERPHDVSPRSGVFVDDGLLAEQRRVPRLALLVAVHGHSDVTQSRKLGHPSPPVRLYNAAR
jgi:hypothetical protein